MLAARHRARRAAGAVRHDPPLQGRLPRRAAQAHARARPAVADRARARRRWPAAEDLAAAEHSSAPRADRRACEALAVRTDLGVDLFCEAAERERLWRGAARPRRPQIGPEQAAECLRIESGRPRYGLDLDDTVIPQEAGAQRARRQLHQGLLRGPGDGRPAASTGASPTATCAACACRPRRHAAAELRLGERVGGAPRQQRRLTAARPDRAGARAPRGGAGRHASLDGGQHRGRVTAPAARTLATFPPRSPRAQARIGAAAALRHARFGERQWRSTCSRYQQWTSSPASCPRRWPPGSSARSASASRRTPSRSRRSRCPSPAPSR